MDTTPFVACSASFGAGAASLDAGGRRAVRAGEPRPVGARHIRMTHGRYGQGMRNHRSGPLAGFLLVAALTVAGCGGSTATVGSGDQSSGSPTASATPSDDTPTAAMVVVRTGGIAGVVDMVRIAADGSASITSKTGKSSACTPSGEALDRLRAIDLAAVEATASRPSGMADGFNYSVKSGTASATASEGDDDSRRADLVDAAAAVVASCLAKRS
jgi:hypothetical protein